MKLSKEIIIVSLIFIFGFSVRFLYVINLPFSASFVGDSPSWEEPALNLLLKKNYGYTKRPPLYPFILAIIYYFFGIHNVMAVKIFQSLLGGITCVIVYFIGKYTFSKFTGVISSVLLCFYPYLVYYTGVILSEVTLSFFISLLIFSLLIVYNHPKLHFIFLSGVILGMTALCKPVIFAFYPFVILWFLVNYSNSIKVFLKYSLIFSLGIIIIIFPWVMRNLFFYKGFLLISPGWQEFWLTNNDVAIQLETVGPKDEPASDDWIWYPKERFQQILKLPMLEAERVFRKEAIEWVKKNPKKFIWLVYRRFLRFWRLWPYMASKRDKIIAGVTSGVYLPLAWVGIVLSLIDKNYRVKSLLLFFLLVSYTLVYLPFHGMIRYRVPIDPIVLVFTGYTLHCVYEKIKGKFIK
ncbi:MAG: glycosyltransferase family 39 protein [Elusimicrobiota bacterium]|nr:glycosyltransferase family 39 protein [Endomicrobiia bacterium]MDW8055345.1 glycosyltransferase family 39 protein [Elusimicrobiota bacterium]MDW8166446.1 glycosyltransferase family 39 protein [Elusimicrobiota bacterium]